MTFSCRVSGPFERRNVLTAALRRPLTRLQLGSLRSDYRHPKNAARRHASARRQTVISDELIDVCRRAENWSRGS